VVAPVGVDEEFWGLEGEGPTSVLMPGRRERGVCGGREVGIPSSTPASSLEAGDDGVSAQARKWTGGEEDAGPLGDPSPMQHVSAVKSLQGFFSELRGEELEVLFNWLPCMFPPLIMLPLDLSPLRLMEVVARGEPGVTPTVEAP